MTSVRSCFPYVFSGGTGDTAHERTVRTLALCTSTYHLTLTWRPIIRRPRYLRYLSWTRCALRCWAVCTLVQMDIPTRSCGWLFYCPTTCTLIRTEPLLCLFIGYTCSFKRILRCCTYCQRALYDQVVVQSFDPSIELVEYFFLSVLSASDTIHRERSHHVLRDLPMHRVRKPRRHHEPGGLNEHSDLHD